MKKTIIVFLLILSFFGIVAWLKDKKRAENIQDGVVEQDISKDIKVSFDGNNFKVNLVNMPSGEMVSVGVTALTGHGGDILGKYSYSVSLDEQCGSKIKSLVIGYKAGKLSLLNSDCKLTVTPSPVLIAEQEWRSFDRFSVSYSYGGGGRAFGMYFCRNDEGSNFNRCEKP
ncbi:hypothetical protein J9978_19335 [Chromobacterium violaceum]|uniref:hypothetical protein n=1 Tax=Chromobacterium violaceum TaxID=536 RepID=UPI001B33ED18|nr:hypothetical protein [Chromobacterium violaceum]MBP4051633.1 hypothetical protein [Chromobacterium violaceum]